MAITLHTDTTEVPEQTELFEGHLRDDFQKDIDAQVGALKLETAKAKWPAHDPKKLWLRFVVSKADKVAFKGVVRRACTLHKVEPVFYKDAVTEAGHIAVKFHVARKRDKDGALVPDLSLNADGTPKPAEAAAAA